MTDRKVSCSTESIRFAVDMLDLVAVLLLNGRGVDTGTQYRQVVRAATQLRAALKVGEKDQPAAVGRSRKSASLTRRR